MKLTKKDKKRIRQTAKKRQKKEPIFPSTTSTFYYCDRCKILHTTKVNIQGTYTGSIVYYFNSNHWNTHEHIVTAQKYYCTYCNNEITSNVISLPNSTVKRCADIFRKDIPITFDRKRLKDSKYISQTLEQYIFEILL